MRARVLALFLDLCMYIKKDWSDQHWEGKESYKGRGIEELDWPLIENSFQSASVNVLGGWAGSLYKKIDVRKSDELALRPQARGARLVKKRKTNMMEATEEVMMIRLTSLP
jgi:hypothetical protein